MDQVRGEGQSRALAASGEFDPFPALIPWLHEVAEGAEVSQWVLNGEGYTQRLIYSRVPIELNTCCGEGMLVIADDEEKRQEEAERTIPLTLEVDPHVLVGVFCRAFRPILSRYRIHSKRWREQTTSNKWDDPRGGGRWVPADVEAWLEKAEAETPR